VGARGGTNWEAYEVATLSQNSQVEIPESRPGKRTRVVDISYYNRLWQWPVWCSKIRISRPKNHLRRGYNP